MYWYGAKFTYEDFDTDVAIEPSSNQSSDEREHVAHCLPAIRADALKARIVSVLALVVVGVATVDDVDSIYEELTSPHGFQEVSRTLHLREEFYEKLCTGICKHAREQAVYIANERLRRKPVIANYGWPLTVRFLSNTCLINGCSN